MRQHNNLFVILSVMWYENENWSMKGNKSLKEAQIFSHRHKSNENTNKLSHK